MSASLITFSDTFVSVSFLCIFASASNCCMRSRIRSNISYSLDVATTRSTSSFSASMTSTLFASSIYVNFNPFNRRPSVTNRSEVRLDWTDSNIVKKSVTVCKEWKSSKSSYIIDTLLCCTRFVTSKWDSTLTIQAETIELMTTEVSYKDSLTSNCMSSFSRNICINIMSQYFLDINEAWQTHRMIIENDYCILTADSDTNASLVESHCNGFSCQWLE